MINPYEFDVSKADIVQDALEQKLLAQNTDISELLPLFCWCAGNKVSISMTLNDLMLSRLKSHKFTAFIKLLANSPLLRLIPESHKQVLCSTLLNLENNSKYTTSIAVCVLLTSKLANQMTFVHNFIAQKTSPFVNISNLHKMSQIAKGIAKHGTFLEEECANCILKAMQLVKKIHKLGLSHVSAFKSITVLLRAIATFCLFTYTNDFQDILYDIENVIKPANFSADQMKYVLEILMACLSKQSTFWRSVCNAAFFFLVNHSNDFLELSISHIFDVLNKDDSFFDVEDEPHVEDSIKNLNPHEDSSDQESDSACSEEMLEIEKKISEYIRLRKDTELAEMKRKAMTKDMRFKLFDWLEILSGKIEHSVQARIIMSKYIAGHTNKHMTERFQKFMNEYYIISKKYSLDADADSFKLQGAIDSFFDTFKNLKHAFLFACDKILVFLLKAFFRKNDTCYEKVVLHVQSLWIDFLAKRKPKNYVHIFASILQNHVFAATIMFSTKIDKLSIRNLSFFETQLLLTHTHRILNQLSELHKVNCLEFMVHVSSSLNDQMNEGKGGKRKLRPEIKKSIRLVSKLNNTEQQHVCI